MNTIRNAGEKRELVRRLAKRTRVKQEFVARFLQHAGEVVAEIADEMGQCRWPGFGRFYPMVRRAHPYYDVARRGMRVCGERRRLKFTAYEAVQNRLNRSVSDGEDAETRP